MWLGIVIICGLETANVPLYHEGCFTTTAWMPSEESCTTQGNGISEMIQEERGTQFPEGTTIEFLRCIPVRVGDESF